MGTTRPRRGNARRSLAQIAIVAGVALSVLAGSLAIGVPVARACPVGALSNATPPVVSPSGPVPYGTILTTTQGTWSSCSSQITGYSYAWFRDGGVISGATSSSYTTAQADGGHGVYAQVTATNDFGSVVSANSNTVTITVPPPPPAPPPPPPPGPPPPPPPPSISVLETATDVTFTNSGGSWTIYKSCANSVGAGPGYIAKVKRFDGVVVVDPTKSALNHAQFIAGLNTFAYHEARRLAGHVASENLPFDLNFAWHVEGNHCDSNGIGVIPAPQMPNGRNVVQPPTPVSGGYSFVIDAWFRDNQMCANCPIIKVRYHYLITQYEVRSWIAITESCPYFAQCGGNAQEPQVYIKEPKIAANITGGGYRRMAIYNTMNHMAGDPDASNGFCDWNKGAPTASSSSGQCSGDLRQRAVFDFATARNSLNKIEPDGCGNNKCLQIVARAASTVGADVSTTASTLAWERNTPTSSDPSKSTWGLDAWAWTNDATPFDKYGLQNTNIDGVVWDCHGGYSSLDKQRRWELYGKTKNAASGSTEATQTYTDATFFFHGWEGGRGYDDCEPLSYLSPGGSRTWGVYVGYSFGASWTVQ